jgi:hypothetical protein
LVEPFAWEIERMFPENASGPETIAEVRAPVAFPVRRPPSVVEPVPPNATEMEVVPMTLPCAFAKRSEEAMVEMAKVVEVALDVVALPVTMKVPFTVEEALVMRPLVKATVVEVETPKVVGLKGKMLANDEDETLLLKSVQSVEAR